MPMGTYSRRAAKDYAPPRMYTEGGANFAILMDTPDIRFRSPRSKNNAHGGFNCVFADGGASFLADPEYMVDDLLAEAGGRGDGRGGNPWGSNDELVFKHMAAERER